MHVVHVVAYVSRDGAFGGPIAVALAQLTELAKRGHNTDFVGGWDGEVVLDAPGVGISLFKVKGVLPAGFSGLWAPGLLRHLRQILRPSSRVHVHVGRDLITLSAAQAIRWLKVPYVLQTHGMIAPKKSLLVKAFDTVLTRQILNNAKSVLALTDQEESDLRLVSRNRAKITRISNGFDKPILSAEQARRRNEVLFLARLHPRKRVLAFAEMAAILSKRRPDATFAVVGPDEGDLRCLADFVARNGLENVLRYEGPVPPGHSVDRLAHAGIFVLPSFGEVFPMTVLEAIAAGTPVVTTDQSGIFELLLQNNAALVTDGTPIELADAVEKILLNDELRNDLEANAKGLLDSVFSIERVVDTVVEAYQSSDPHQMP